MKEQILKILLAYTKLGHNYKGGESDIVVMFNDSFVLTEWSESEREFILANIAEDIENEIKSEEEKIKRLIQRRIDELEKQWWENEVERGSLIKRGIINNQCKLLKDLLKEIETL